MSDNTPIFDQLVAEFAAERKIHYESLLVPAPEFKPFRPVVMPLQEAKAMPKKPGAVRKSNKTVWPIFDDIIAAPFNHSEIPSEQEIDEKIAGAVQGLFSEESRLARKAEIDALVGKRYRTDPVEYTGADTQEIDVTLLQTSKTLRPLG